MGENQNKKRAKNKPKKQKKIGEKKNKKGYQKVALIFLISFV